MTHLIVQVGVQTRLLWLDNRHLHQIIAVVTIFVMIHDLYLLLICQKIKAYFAGTKMPPDDISSTSDFITSDEQAKQTWNDWSPWTVTEDKFELTTESQIY